MNKNSMLTLEGYEEAFIGFTEKNLKKFIAIYDRNKCIDIVMKNQNLDREKAIEWFEKNVDEKLMGDDTPLVLFPMGYEKYLDLAKYLWGHTEHQNDNTYG